MVKINLYRITNGIWQNIFTVKPNQYHFSSLELSADLGAPAQLNMTISPTAGEFYRLLSNDFAFELGLSVEQDEVQYAFVNSRQPRKTELNGMLSLGFIGASYLLKYTQFKYFNKVGIRDIDSFLLGLDGNVRFINISNNLSVDINTGAMSNYDLLTEAIGKIGNFNWRDNGLFKVNDNKYIPEILFGNFAGIENYYATNTNPKYRVYNARSTNFAHPYDDIYLNSINENYSGEVYSHVLIYLGSSGTNSKTVFTIDNTTEDRVKKFQVYDNDYPIINENGIYYVYNSKYKYSRPKYISKQVDESTNDNNSISVTSLDTAHVKMYLEAVKLHKENEENINYTVDPVYKKLVYPGNRINVVYKNYHTWIDGEKKIMDINDTYILRDVKVNILNL